MILGTLAYFWLGRSVAVYEDRFFIMAIAVTVIAATAYLAMALGMGRLEINNQEVMVVRYMDWMLTTPLIIALLGILAKASKELIATLIGVDLYMIGAGFLGVIAEPLWQSVLWWGIGCAAYVLFLYLFLGAVSKAANEQPDDVAGMYTTLRNLTLVLWTLYPLVWITGSTGFDVLPALAEEGSIVSLDILSKVVFGYILLSSHETLRVYDFYGEGRREGTPIAGEEEKEATGAE